MIAKTIEKYIKLLPERDAEILKLRFGLGDEGPYSLQKIGSKYGITRERVRQVQNESINKIKEAILNDEKLNKVIILGKKLIRQTNGFSDLDLEKQISQDFGFGTKENHIRFILILDPEIKLEGKDDFHERFYVIKEKKSKIKDFFHSIAKKLHGQKLDYEKFKDKILFVFNKKLKEDLNEKSFTKILKISKKIWLNPFNEGGHEENFYIAPKNTKHRILTVFHYHKKPLHFREIYEILKKVREKFHDLIHPSWNKITKLETIHNELIRHPDFVLVGRGLYALSNWGYSGKTVEELILEYLSNVKKPVKREDVINYVLSKKIVKPSGVSIVLYRLKGKVKFLENGMVSL
jgi:hypothetical protein